MFVTLRSQPKTAYNPPTTIHLQKNQNHESSNKYSWDIVWFNVFVLGYLHLAAVYGLVLVLTGNTKISTICWGLFVGITSSMAVTGGAHRLWAHKTYKANLPLRILLATFMTMTFQNHIYEWARDHRVHHKYAETDADPHNAKRGFFFSHVGWLMVKKHKDVIEKGKTVDVSDLEQDSVVVFQRKYYAPLVLFGTFIFPMLVPWYFWNESISISWHVATVLRYVMSVNMVWCTNSAAHLYGTKPYDKNIGPTQNQMMLIIGLGEGFHNYHHTFPWDYKAAEFGNDIRNITTSMIDFFAKIGWATELKTTSPEMIRRRAFRTGDGTWDGDLTEMKRNFVEKKLDDSKEEVWGWGDKAMGRDEMREIQISNGIICSE
ncbi:PREDICTED: stearoyl-CoA desaturase 5-like [Nicrophorus vespilloides]|uniref:Stearoyl-CoA desaturase 5-like n=1 Tax=Nicrophorus vespilloides TaxID=110193 RepID=A0ABM1MJF6_NICVS|nr:PREDICTED: stearoyl-CoA desaturase 5-like [Nicrophorus vespilloides]